jgi:hypothetical protein
MKPTPEMIEAGAQAVYDRIYAYKLKAKDKRDAMEAIRKDVEAALQAALDAMWQPIKTAPKDGRPVLLWPYYPKDDYFYRSGQCVGKRHCCRVGRR